MARRPLTLGTLLDLLEPDAAEAFMRAVRDLQNDAGLAALEAAIAAGDVEAAMQALNMHQAEAYFEPLSEELRKAFVKGGNHAFAEAAVASRRVGAAVTGRLDATSPRAERLLREVSSQHIVEIAETVRATVREVLGEAMGGTDASPRKVALDIAGRINRATGRREGGILGLTSMEARWVLNMRDELTDPARMGNYFTREARDRRFDRTVAKALKDGVPVADADIERIANRYHDTLLRGRGERIARTEVLGSLHIGRDEGIHQMIDRGDISEAGVTYVWKAAQDGATRDTHKEMHGQRRNAGELFESPSGATLAHPGDPNAPAAEIINCRCFLATEMDFITGLRDRLDPSELADVRQAMEAV